MAKAVVDPEALQRFAAQLKRFTGEVQGQLAVIHRQFLKLGETWQDQEHSKFAEDFERAIHVMDKLASSSEKQIPILLRKAQSIREYLGKG